MIPRSRRISKELFKELKRGKNVDSPLFSMRIYSISSKKSYFSVIISKKDSKTAVARNRVKRVFYLLIRENIKDIKGGFAIVFYPKKSIFSIKNIDLKELFVGVLQKSDLLV